jgi:hypothetical protein
VHHAWRRALDLDGMLEELSRDAREAEQVVEQLHASKEAAHLQKEQEAHARQLQLEKERTAFWSRWGAIGLGIGSVAGLLHLVDVAVDWMYPTRKFLLQALKGDNVSWETLAAQKQFADAIAMYEAAHLLETKLLVAAIVLGIVLGIVAHKAGSKLGGH